MSGERPDAIEAVTRALPDPQGARAFWQRLQATRPLAYDRDPRLASRLLTLAAYSPFLAEILLRHPEHIDWLRRETEHGFDRVKTTEQLSEDLARFVTRSFDIDHRTRLARFKRRELLRIYLRDCLHIATLAEVTEELSNLADVILRHALALAHQEMTNLHGAPLTRDERGRIENAEFAVVALGKLGCRELNYASDIDLLFLYAGEGETAGDGRRRESRISNREFFKGVAERVVQMIASSAGEGAVYRVDLRLRPYGRDGDLVWEIQRAADYYRDKAQNWERQALIRVRASAGSEAVVARFLGLVRDLIFAPDARAQLMENVRRAKEKIDRRVAAQAGGFNVKLGRGGIREIEFIAQALQLRYGGREPWLRSAQTLIVLARLAEKQYLSEAERAQLSAAYTFLRTLEHRLQMEHGAQTHTLPLARERLALVARRYGLLHADDAAGQLLDALEAHTTAVRAIYHRVFAESGDARATTSAKIEKEIDKKATKEIDDEAARLVRHAVASLVKLMAAQPVARREEVATKDAPPTFNEEQAEQAIVAALPFAINPLRALRNLAAWAESLATYARDAAQSKELILANLDWADLIKQLLPTLSSQYLAHLLVSRPALAAALADQSPRDASGFYHTMRAAVAEEKSIVAKTDALRRAWYRQVIAIGYKDMAVVSGHLSADDKQATNDQGQMTNDHLRLNNLAQTALAEATLRLALEIALESLGITSQHASVRDVEQQATDNEQLTADPRPPTPASPPTPDLPFAILGLGRLGHAGMDYGSDLDLLVVYDDSATWPPARLADDRDALAAFHSAQEFYAKLTAEIVRALSSITREGLLYRIDLRLRPEGKSGALAQGLSSLLAYLGSRASAWEHSAYLKAREVAGDLAFGMRVREAICETCFDAASRNSALKEELADMRVRLEQEKARRDRPNVKWGRGGMTDVYFVTRYLQLRDRVAFPTEQGTAALIAHLGARASLDAESARALYEGYSFLRQLDHWMRLLLDRPTPLLPASQVALTDLARALGFSSIEEFEQQFVHHTAAIRAVYDRVFA